MNPPKIMRDATFDLDSLEHDMKKFYGRISKLVSLVDGIHLTDSVLGIPRVSSISAAREIVKMHPGVRLRCSIRVRDRNLSAIMQLVSDAILMGVDGLLIVKGDRPERPSVDSGLRPSEVVNILNQHGFGDRIKLFLSVPCEPDPNKIKKKMEVKPYGFITQSLGSLEQLQKIVGYVKGNNIKVASTIMVPSPKNKECAALIDLNWREYENDVYSFIRHAHDMCGEVLITSPNSFNEGIDLLSKIIGGKKRIG